MHLHEEIQDYIIKSDQLQLNDREELFSFICKQKEKWKSHSQLIKLLDGEEAFYQNNYENALKNYMQIKEVPHSDFFYFRASACVSKQNQQREKALQFAQQALTIYPKNSFTQHLVTELQTKETTHMYENDFAKQFLLGKSEEMTDQEIAKERQEVQKSLIEERMTDSYLADKLQAPLKSDYPLVHHIKEFEQRLADHFMAYLDLSESQCPHEKCLYILNGFPSEDAYLFSEKGRKSTGGYFFEWDGVGVAINPGHNFLKHFHEQGLTVRDIDCVIVTDNAPHTHTDLKEIYSLNYHLNCLDSKQHVIRYYLNHQVFQQERCQLEPHFKEERNTVFSLDVFHDLSEDEAFPLHEAIKMRYFSTTKKKDDPLGVIFELTRTSATGHPEVITIGLISQMGWSPLLAHHLSQCSIVIAGFGETNEEDCQCLQYPSNCLGYFGSFSLLEELTPQLVICTEFDGKKGDIRLEAVSQLRQEFLQANYTVRHTPIVIPMDQHGIINLHTQEICCYPDNTFTHATQVRIARSDGEFSELRYMSPSDLI